MIFTIRKFHICSISLVDKIEENCVCADACTSAAYALDESMSSFSELSVNNLLDHDTRGIQEKYQAAREIRERLEPQRLADFLNKHKKITNGLTTYLGQASYISSNATTSLRLLSTQMIKAFFTDIVQIDMRKLFGDIEKYKDSYEAMYQPGRSTVTKQLTDINDEVTHYIKVLYEARFHQNNVATFKGKMYGLSKTLVGLIVNVKYAIDSLNIEHSFINELFIGNTHQDFQPRKLYDSKLFQQECDQLQTALKRNSLDGIRQKVRTITVFFDQNPSVTDSALLLNGTLYIIGNINVGDMITDLHPLSFHLGNQITQVTKCLNSYYNLLTNVETFGKANYLEDKSKDYLPVIEYNTEIKQEDLVTVRCMLVDLEVQVAEYKKKKLEIGGEINETLVSSIDKQLEALRTSINSEILDKITSSVETIVSTVSKTYEDSFQKMIQLWPYLTAKHQIQIQNKAKELLILLGVSFLH